MVTTSRRSQCRGGLAIAAFGDIQAQLFVTPNRSSDLVWGIGPIFSLPTATLDASTTGSWGVGGLATQSTAPLITANRDAPSGETWTVPLGGGLTWTTTNQGDPGDAMSGARHGACLATAAWVWWLESRPDAWSSASRRGGRQACSRR